MASDFWVNAVGTAAGVASMLSFLPQIVKIWRECDASFMSLGTFAVSAAAFGALQGSSPIIVSNAVCLMLVLTIVALRLKFSDDA